MIRLFAGNETDFTHNKYMLRNVINCEVTEVENGIFDLVLEYPVNPDIQEEVIIKAPTPRGEQLFVIESVTKTLRGYRAYAIDYISSRLKKNFLEDVRPTNLNCQNAINHILSNCSNPVPFTATSDIPGTNTAYYIRMNPLQALIGAENSILNNYGGYLKRDGMNIHVAKEPQDIGYDIRMGKNLVGVEQSIDIADVITRIYPTAVLQDNTVAILPEKYVDSDYLTSYAQNMIREIRVELTDEEKKLSTPAIHDIMRARAREEFSKGIDLPKIHYNIDFIQLENQSRIKPDIKYDYERLERLTYGEMETISYDQMGSLSQYSHDELSDFSHDELSLKIHGVAFGDPTDVLEKMNQLDISHMVNVYVPKLNIYVKARVIRYVYDAVRRRFKSIELGDYKPMERYLTQNILLNMNRNLKLKANQKSIDTPTHVLTENGFELKDESGGLLINKYGSVNNDNFSGSNNVEEDHPLWIPFEIDTDVSMIKKVSLWWKNFPYRASAKSIAGGGGGIITTPSGGGDTSGPSSTNTSEYDAPPNFSTGYQVTDTEDPTKHFHVVSSNAMSHRHNMAHTHETKAHQHEFELDNHTHPLEFGIVETPIIDDTITIFIDGTERLTVNARTGKADITEWITEVGDHEIELRSSTKKFIHVNVALKTYIKG